MIPNRLVEKIFDATGITFNINADDDGNGRVKVVRNVGDWRYAIRYNQEDDTKTLLIIKHRNLETEHKSKQKTKKALAMLLKHIASPTPAFKLLWREQETSD